MNRMGSARGPDVEKLLRIGFRDCIRHRLCCGWSCLEGRVASFSSLDFHGFPLSVQ
ncbi:unnamed protein product [Periconia digitata]|uniref:Uncharacterized protein n=1 Tax=Periconia digitata TaxID=1303443 RepID=A0A9W4XK52_9PLEO|nr:unnamed protein product [Periconia digitata]